MKSKVSSKLLFFHVFFSTGKTGTMPLFINTVKLLALDCFQNHGHERLIKAQLSRGEEISCSQENNLVINRVNQQYVKMRATCSDYLY